MRNDSTPDMLTKFKEDPEAFMGAIMLAAVHHGILDEHDARATLALAETPDVTPEAARLRRIRLLDIILTRLRTQLGDGEAGA